jgi:hypothetical protein
MSTDELNSDHERRREKHRPQQSIVELGASLGIGRDPRRIVIGRARDEAGTEEPKDDIARLPFGSGKLVRRDMDVPSTAAAASTPYAERL